MRARTVRTLMIGMIVAGVALVALLALAACSMAGGSSTDTGGQEPVPSPTPSNWVDPEECGGTTDYSDSNAAKHIESKEIVEFSARFFVYDEVDSALSSLYWFDIVPDQDRGEGYVLSETSGEEQRVHVDGKLLADVQEIIDRFNLVNMNGEYRVTAGLPAEYQPSLLSVVYASGETLYFTVNGDPEAAWARAFKKLFAQALAEGGAEGYLPSKEATTIERFQIGFTIGDLLYDYGIIVVPAEQKDGSYKDVDRFYRGIYNLSKDKSVGTVRVDVSDELFTGLQQVVEDCGLEALHGTPIDFSMEHSADGSVEIFIDYQSGRQIYAQFEGEDIPDEWPAMRDALMAYFDGVLAA